MFCARGWLQWFARSLETLLAPSRDDPNCKCDALLVGDLPNALRQARGDCREPLPKDFQGASHEDGTACPTDRVACKVDPFVKGPHNNHRGGIPAVLQEGDAVAVEPAKGSPLL